jgi:ABC-2 type transport system ATP-binding protein
MLQIKNLKKSYGHITALNGINLNVKRNEVYGFIGKNGAGKTTAIELILDFIKKDEGSIVFDGTPIQPGDVLYKNKIGYVPDAPVFPKYLSAREFLKTSFDFSNNETLDKTKQVEQVLKFVNLEDKPQKIGGFSRGMKQRLSIAQALIHKPEFLIMDEPTSALDPIGRMEMLKLIRVLSKSMTIFYSTHILEDAEKVCDRIGLLDKGNLLIEGSKKDLFENKETTLHTLITSKSNEETLKVLNTLDTLKKVSVKNELLRIELGKTQPFTLFKKLHEANIEVRSFKEERKTLEELFVEVTNDEGTA